MRKTPQGVLSERSPIKLRIQLNQVGYEAEGPKVVVVAADEPFPELKIAVADRHDRTKKLLEGTIAAARLDDNSGDWTAQADLGDLKIEGWYCVEVEGNESVPFYIGDDIYRELFIQVARSYRLQRSGEAIDDPLTGLKLRPGHLQDKKAVVAFNDENGQQPVIDVGGGWYDAGDYGKYIPPAAITVAQMLLAYELRPDFFAERRFLVAAEKSHWPSGNNAPDALSEAKFELDWMLRMQREDGAVYHKVSGKVFPGFIVPEEDTQERAVYGMSTYGTAMFAAAAAMGARIFEPFDAEYAAKLLENAKKAQAWLDAHPKASFRMDEGQNSGSGPYYKKTDREERFWALAELFKTTGEADYDAAVSEGYDDLIGGKADSVCWNNGQLLGQWAVATARRQASAGQNKAMQAIREAAEDIVAHIGQDGYRCALGTADYTWASAKNALAKAETLLLANELSPNSAYRNAAADQLHYVLGRNAMGMSYVTGTGTVFPLHPHHRISEAAGILVPGLLVGGPNRYLNDPVLEKMSGLGLPPAKSYIDDLGSYASNEYAIDYNAPLFFVLAFMH